jgi:hypothetical protein
MPFAVANLKNAWGSWLFLVTTCLIFGLVTAVSPLAAAFAVTTVFGIIMGFIIPLKWMILAELVLAMMISGSIEYFLGVSQANWLPYLLALVIGFRSIAEKATESSRAISGKHSHARHNSQMNAWIWIPCFIYMATMVASTALNMAPIAQTLVAIKNYIFMWGLLLAYINSSDFTLLSKNTWKTFIAVAVLQLPVVLYQKFVISAKLSNAGGAAGLSWDAVSGTFGGGVLGGHSSAMALCITVAMIYGLLQWREGKWPIKWVVALALATMPSIIFAEVKASIVWIAFGGLLVFARQIRKKPAQFIGGTLMMCVLAGGIAVAYKTMYYDDGSRYISNETLFDRQIYYFFDPDKFNAETREMGRIASIIFWWRENKSTNAAYIGLGHGLGSSRGQSSIAIGTAAKKYSFFIDTSATTVLLWDVGLIGLFSYLIFQIATILRAFRLAFNPTIPLEYRIQLECAYIGLLIITSGLLYNREAIDNASIQTISLFFLALVLHGSKMLANPSLNNKEAASA